jgi:ATP-dependent helicase HrpB
MKVSYSPGERPRGRAKIQDLYGLNETPTVADGRQPLVLEILGPNFRPVQVTDDLSGFWTNHYPQLKKMLQRRYPKHEWR